MLGQGRRGRGLGALALLALLSVGLPWSAAADPGTAGAVPIAQASPGMGTDLPESVRHAPVVVDGVTLFEVRGIASFPATERAGDIVERIEQVARDPAIAPDAVKVVEVPQGSAIRVGDLTLMFVTDGDAAAEGIERTWLAALHARHIVQSITRYRADRTPAAQWRHAGFAAGAAAALGVALYGLLLARRRVDALLERRYRARLERLEIHGFRILHAEHLWSALRSLAAGLFTLLALACIFAALNFALGQFPATRGAARSLLHLIASPLVKMGEGLLAAVPGLVFLVILTLVTRYVLQTLRLLFGAIEQGSVKFSGFDAEWSWPTYRIVRLLVVAFAVVVAFPYIPGSGSDAFKGVSLFLGIVFSLGSTSIIANIIAGYSMTYRRAFRVGDRIRIGDVVGDVTEARLQVTHVRSLKNEEVVIPNSLILNSSVVNYTTLAKSQGLILHTIVGIGYETPWRQVEAMLIEAAGRTERLLKQPAPFVLQKSLGDFAVNYELNAYCDRPGEMTGIYTDLHRHILDVFNEYGVAIMTPAYVADPEQAKLVPKDQWYLAPAVRPPAAG